MSDSRIASDNEYLGELLRAEGYSSFHATDEARFSIIRPQFGFDDLLHPRLGLVDWTLGSLFDFSALNLARQSHLGHDIVPAIANNRASVAYNPRIWTRNLLKRINRLPADQPVFLAIHLCGNHWPFTSVAPYSW